ncbi:MAG: DUF502 domain-containing protein [Limisphaerales bacterium]
MAKKENDILAQFRANFFTGLAIVMPAVISIAVVVWLFRNVANLTDYVLFFVPHRITHENHGLGEMYWYWSLCAFILAILLISLIGRFGRNYFARKAIQWTDNALLRIPLLNKIYGTIKQVNESFSSNKSSFKQVVLVAFPHQESRSVGFVTGEQKGLDNQKWISVFIPTTPNPTSGFLIMVRETEITKLDISVAEGIKFIISLGAISPDVPGLAALKPSSKD